MVALSTVAYTLGGLTAGAAAVLMILRRRNSKKWINVENCPGLDIASKRLDGQVIVITGGNTGLGYWAALELARRGPQAIILACRNVVAGSEAAKKISAATGHKNVTCMLLDLASLESVRTFATELKQNYSRLDTLVCNAGVWMPMQKKSKTADGFELHAGVNHLGHFLFVNLLRDHGNPRIVVVSSGLSGSGQVTTENMEDLLYTGRFDGKGPSFAPSGYCDSKLMNVMFVKELIRRFPDCLAYSLCPGMCKTELGRNVSFPFYKKLFMIPLFFIFVRTAFQGAQNILYAVLEDSDKLVNGGLYRDGKLVSPTDEKANKSTSENEMLWDLSVRAVDLEADQQ